MLKPCSNPKVILLRSSTHLRVFETLGQIRNTEPKIRIEWGLAQVSGSSEGHLLQGICGIEIIWGDWAEIPQIERVIYRKSSKVLNSMFHAKWVLTQAQRWSKVHVVPALVCLGIETSHGYWALKPQIKGKDTQSSKVLSSTFHIKWSLTQG